MMSDLWPSRFALDVAETGEVYVAGQVHKVTLHAAEHVWEPDYWIAGNAAHRTLREARVMVTVDGVEATLRLRPYQAPVEVGGLRLYIESTCAWDSEVTAGAEAPAKDVTFSAVSAGQSWGPDDLRFPIRDYRWRGATYNNTWSALAPYNSLYYCQGEDFGAIPDRLDVVAMRDGVVVASPLPSAKDSNLIAISAGDFVMRYAHINIETLSPRLTVGARVQAGQVLGKTGCTWQGRRSQWADPHLHVSFVLADQLRSPYPFLVEAYLRDYPDAVLPVAGGYTFTTVGQSVTLDASCTVVRPGDAATAYIWRLHDGQTLTGQTVEVAYDAPGQYAVELTVKTEAGAVDCDFAHVRVYDPRAARPKSLGWIYSWPLRGVHPGTPVLFWNRLLQTYGPVTIDFGDGWPGSTIENDAWYTYRAPGIYTVTVCGYGTTGEPVMSKLRVVVE
ncbi:MAG: PKD domain-containing protein [Anaerolineae bacterium]|nr:PKD domain-containing protein [Anaerolineae bacterium]